MYLWISFSLSDSEFRLLWLLNWLMLGQIWLRMICSAESSAPSTKSRMLSIRYYSWVSKRISSICISLSISLKSAFEPMASVSAVKIISFSKFSEALSFFRIESIKSGLEVPFFMGPPSSLGSSWPCLLSETSVDPFMSLARGFSFFVLSIVMELTYTPCSWCGNAISAASLSTIVS